MQTTAATPTYKFKVQEKKGLGVVCVLEFDSQPTIQQIVEALEAHIQEQG